MDNLPADQRLIAYFSMEIGFDPAVPTYSGGLGVLAGDTLKACADMKLPIVGTTLLSEQGYFTQTLDPQDGHQIESPDKWNYREMLQLLPARVTVQIQHRDVVVQAWQHTLKGITGFEVPILFLDTDVQENNEEDRRITAVLYGGDQKYRLMQEIVLGIGGVRMLKALGYTSINRHHMNEGHAALLSLELFKEHALVSSCPLTDFQACMEGSMDAVRKLCVFTTHTPVAAGHDKFPYPLVQEVLGEFVPFDLLKRIAGQDALNMTLLALNLSHYVNSVAKKHQDVSQHLFPGYHFSFITNGVHSATWTCPAMAELYDRYTPGWRFDSFELRHVLNIPKHELGRAHQSAKDALIDHVNATGAEFTKDAFTIGFARRATAYKRADLLFADIKRLRDIGGQRKIQLIFAGKAHPRDTEGKALIQKIRWNMGEVHDVIKVIYLPDYDIDLAKLLIPGVDLWLNTPARPHEASGTSGMKAAHNAVPSFSVLDGWWIEGHNEGVTGWSIGPNPTEENETLNDNASDAKEIYDKLEKVILPMFYDDQEQWQRVMRNTIAFNASFFNTHRMVQQYALKAYLR